MSGRYRELLRRYFLPQWPSAAALLVLLLVAAAAQVLRPRLIAGFIDAARAGATTGRLSRFAVAFLAIAIVQQLVDVSEAFLAERSALIATNRLRADLTLHCLRLDLAFHNEHRPGELIQRIDGDVASLANFFSRFLVALVANALLLAGALAMMATIDWRLGACLAGFSALVLFTLYRMRFAARPRWERALQAQAEQSGFLEEHLSATEDIRSSGATEYAMRRFFEHARELLHRRRRASAMDSFVGGTSTALFTIGTGAALAFAAWLFRQGELSIGTVFLVFTYAEMLSRPIQAINRQIQDLQAAAAAVGRVYELLDTAPAIVDGPGAPIAPGPLGAELARVWFRYADEEPLLEDVSIRIEPGRVLGLLGRTGSGKTTITRLLLRFYDPQAGEVRVGDVDVRLPSLRALRDRVGLVTQEVQLLHASVRDNLTFFDPSVSDERVIDVIVRLGLGAWLESLPRGLDTQLASGETGLSSGEAQLLAFARVFLRDPGIVVLDEATSRLDPASELRVERAVDRLFEGRTAIVIAHRLRTVLRADDILVLEGGRVVEFGPRESLASDDSSRFAGLLRTGLEEVIA
jgi:ABC-type multidrug transport system fused ATPase/permease subunit